MSIYNEPINPAPLPSAFSEDQRSFPPREERSRDWKPIITVYLCLCLFYTKNKAKIIGCGVNVLHRASSLPLREGRLACWTHERVRLKTSIGWSSSSLIVLKLQHLKMVAVVPTDRWNDLHVWKFINFQVFFPSCEPPYRAPRARGPVCGGANKRAPHPHRPHTHAPVGGEPHQFAWRNGDPSRWRNDRRSSLASVLNTFLRFSTITTRWRAKQTMGKRPASRSLEGRGFRGVLSSSAWG